MKINLVCELKYNVHRIVRDEAYDRMPKYMWAGMWAAGWTEMGRELQISLGAQIGGIYLEINNELKTKILGS